MCPKCIGTGIYYTKEFAGVKVHPCSCEESKAERKAQEQKFENFLERLNKQYEEFYGRSAPSFIEHQRTKSNRENRELLPTV